MPKITLSKTITAHGEEVTELDLREPTGGDFIDLGHPLIINADGSFSFNMGVVAAYISRLGKIPPWSVRDIVPSDLQTLAVQVSGFLGAQG